MDIALARLVRVALAFAVLAAVSAPAAEAVTALGLQTPHTLVNFDTSTPNDVRIRPITGLATGTETAVGMDMRPATGEVFAFEELVGSHGGLGGTQTRPFVLHPVDLDAGSEPIVGAMALNAVLERWRTDLGPEFNA